MSKKIIFNSNGQIIYNNLYENYTIYDCRYDDSRNLILYNDKIKQLVGDNCNSVLIEQIFDNDGFFIGNNFKILFQDKSIIKISTELSDCILINSVNVKDIDLLLTIIDFINLKSDNYYNFVKIKYNIEHFHEFSQRGFYVDESNKLFIIKDLNN